jgi:hypothetical protein
MATHKRTTQEVLDGGLQLIGDELDRLKDRVEHPERCVMCQRALGLDLDQTKAAVAYVSAACKLAAEEREAAKSGSGKGDLAAQIAQALKEDPQLWVAVEQHLAAGRAS